METASQYKRRLFAAVREREPEERLNVLNDALFTLRAELRVVRQAHLDRVKAIRAEFGDGLLVDDRGERIMTLKGRKRDERGESVVDVIEEIQEDLNEESAPALWNGFCASTCLSHCFAGLDKHPLYGEFFQKLAVLHGLADDFMEQSHEHAGWQLMATCVGCHTPFEEYGFQCANNAGHPEYDPATFKNVPMEHKPKRCPTCNTKAGARCRRCER